MLTREQLTGIMPNCDPNQWLDVLNRDMAQRHIDTPARIAMFLAHVAVESGETRTVVENMNYSIPRLMAVWPKRFPTAELAALYAHDPEKLGNFVYANRLGNGPPDSGDGFRYRGRGLLQATGRDHYAEAAAALALDLVNHPELLESPDAASRESCWWWEKRGCNDLADQGDIHQSTLVINGGLNGYPDRVAYWRRALKVLGAAAAGANADVAAVQQALNDRGANPPLTADGIWGPMSEAAADQFRTYQGMPDATGIDDALRAALGLETG